MKLQSLGSNLYLDWSPDGNYIVTGNSTNHLIVWDVRTGNQLKKKKFNYEVKLFHFLFLILTNTLKHR